MSFFSVIILNYDIIFIIINLVAFNTFPCRKIMVEEGEAKIVNYLEESSKVSNNVSLKNSKDAKMVEKNVIYISDSILCASMNHMITMFLATILL